MKPTVLVVDDDPDIRALLSDVLTLEGYRVQTAEHGGPALDIMRASSEHLLVMLGLVMPVVDGLAVLEAVAANEAFARRHVIIVVSAAVNLLRSGRGAELCQQLDVAVVPKPSTSQQFFDAIADAERRWVARYGDAQTVRTMNEMASPRKQTLLEPGAQDGEHREGEQNEQNGQGTEDIQDLLDRAHTLLGQFKYEEALPLSQRAVEVAPRSVKAWCKLGSNYGDLGRVADLERAFEQALRLVVTPRDEVEVWYYRGHAENNAGAWLAALHSFQRLAELDPDWGVPLRLQGMVLGNMGTFLDWRFHEEALVAFDRAVALGGLSSVDQRVVYSLKAKSLYGLEREEEAKVYDRRADEMSRAEQAERASSSRASESH